MTKQQVLDAAKHHREFLTVVFVVKITVMVGLIVACYLPQEHAYLVGLATNLLWLWKA
jgi:hypothetical protein